MWLLLDIPFQPACIVSLLDHAALTAGVLSPHMWWVFIVDTSGGNISNMINYDQLLLQ